MRQKLMLTMFLLGIFTVSYSQQNSTWNKWSWLTGEWVGEGGGQPGQGGGTFSFKTDLDGKILVRKSHAEYPASVNKPKIVHDDLMIVYAENNGDSSKAVYFDNEGHIIHYSITYAEKSIVFLSDKIPHVPVFRLTYSMLDNGGVNTAFEMSQDGKKFMMYVEGKSKKVN